MLVVDTNIVVRYLANDDTAQAARARRLLGQCDAFLPLTVLLETEWVLPGVFNFAPADVANALRGFALERDEFNRSRRGIPESEESRFNLLAGDGGQHEWRDPTRWIFVNGRWARLSVARCRDDRRRHITGLG